MFCKYDTVSKRAVKWLAKGFRVTYICMYVCTYSTMYACMHIYTYVRTYVPYISCYQQYRVVLSAGGYYGDVIGLRRWFSFFESSSDTTHTIHAEKWHAQTVSSSSVAFGWICFKHSRSSLFVTNHPSIHPSIHQRSNVERTNMHE